MKQRLCNNYGCTGIMRPTRELRIPIHIEEYYKDDQETLDDFTLRKYKCVECGSIFEWMAYPWDDHYSAASLHKFKHRDGWNSISMASDPTFCPAKPPQKPTRPKRPVRIV